MTYLYMKSWFSSYHGKCAFEGLKLVLKILASNEMSGCKFCVINQRAYGKFRWALIFPYYKGEGWGQQLEKVSDKAILCSLKIMQLSIFLFSSKGGLSKRLGWFHFSLSFFGTSKVGWATTNHLDKHTRKPSTHTRDEPAKDRTLEEGQCGLTQPWWWGLCHYQACRMDSSICP